MSSNPPTVVAHYSVPPVMHQRLCDEQPHVECEGVTIEVTFALGQHRAALAFLERAVEDVRAQITAAGHGGVLGVAEPPPDRSWVTMSGYHSGKKLHP